MRYYKVQAKFGHVGKNNYLIKSIYIKAKNGKDAAYKARRTSRVKHHKKDAILDVKQIELEEYSIGIRAMENDNYFKVHNKQDQIELKAVSINEIIREPEEIKYKKKRNGQRLRNIEKEKLMNKQMMEEFEYE